MPRKYQLYIAAFIFLPVALDSCETLKESSKYNFTEGYYHSRLYHKKNKKVYVVPDDDSIKVYSAKKIREGKIDTTKSIKIAFPADQKPAQFENYMFTRSSFDLDVLTVLFKYRPAVPGFPRQFNATFNGAVYTGYRFDTYQLHYDKNPMEAYKRTITHYGYSFGIFSGFGSARIDEYVTNNAINIEYDGVVNLTGVAAIVAVNKLTFGLTFGVDHLLDSNRHHWVNQGKPWVGLSLGLNLN